MPPNSVPRVLVVDDDERNRTLLVDLLSIQGYECEEAADGFEAIAKVGLDIDLVLLDVMLPNIDGFEVVRRVRANPATDDIPIIMVTALGGRAEKIQALEAGASDFLTKPVDRLELQVRTRSSVAMKQARDALKITNAQLELKVEGRTAELRAALSEMAASRRTTYEAHLDTIRRLAVAAEYKDSETAHHIHRMAGYSCEIGKLIGLSSGETDTLYFGSLMHDVGKIGIPDTILLKPGRLTPEERKSMEEHPTIGARILSDSLSELIQAGKVVALSHHEWWNGGGYPNGSEGEGIPLFGRISAIADVYDALTSKRPYKPAFSEERAIDILKEGRGTHFDPELLDVFLDHFDEVTAGKPRSTYAF